MEHFGCYLDCKRPLMHPFDDQQSLNYHIMHTMYIKCKYDCFKRMILIFNDIMSPSSYLS